MRSLLATGGCATALLLFPAAAAAFHDEGDAYELDVGIAQTQSSASIDAGETVTYTVTVTNREQSRSRSIGFDMHVSKPGRYGSKVDARYTGFSSSVGRCELAPGSSIPNQYAQCEAAHVPPAGQVTFMAFVRANESITHWADLTGAQIGEFPPCCFRDNSPADNSARLDTSVVPPDTTAPDTTLRILSNSLERVVDKGKLKAKVTTDEAAEVKLYLKFGRKTIGKKTLEFDEAKTRTVNVRVTRTGRDRLEDRDDARLKLIAKSKDEAGNKATDKKAKTL
jgi:hypothetical protein